MRYQHPWLVGGRLIAMIAALLGVSGLYRSTVGLSQDADNLVSVFQTVYSQCILINVSLGYYCLIKLCMLIIYPPSTARRREQLVPGSDDVAPARQMHTLSGAVVLSADLSEPLSSRQNGRAAVGTRLTIHNVWVLVYGLGFVFFITGYCFLGLQPVCLTFIGLAVGVLSVDELLCPRRELHPSPIHHALVANPGLLVCTGFCGVEVCINCRRLLTRVRSVFPLLFSVHPYHHSG